ncbi:hypothetical protein AB0D78_42580 [Streptomyces avermitilis]|uniref:hypothetical protein n=1 Tax=Streptomyces avermitilis TaxID=33903 RepID=UPI0034078ACD
MKHTVPCAWPVCGERFGCAELACKTQSLRQIYGPVFRGGRMRRRGGGASQGSLQQLPAAQEIACAQLIVRLVEQMDVITLRPVAEGRETCGRPEDFKSSETVVTL